MTGKPARNDVVELSITDLGFEGKGIGKINGDFVVFVPNTVPGDVLKARIKKVKKNFAEASIEELLKSSNNRVSPECEYFGTCNGCKMQNIDYAAQLVIKQQHVLNAFERIGGFKDINIPPVISSDDIYFYRNKLEFSFSNNRWLTSTDMNDESADKSFALGYHIPGFIDKILDIKKCYLQSESSNKILNLTRDFFKSKNTSVYSTKTASGFLRFLVIRKSANTNDMMVNLITNTDDKDLIAEYTNVIQREIPEVTTLINSVSTTKAQVAKADYFNVIFGKGFIEEKIGKYTFKITPNSFFQTNSRQSKKLFDEAVDFAEFKTDENVLDLYCGCGAISLYISEYVKTVHGVELSPESIQMAEENAALNNVSNCTFEASDVKDFMSKIQNSAGKYDTIILDPPRSGIHPKIAEYIIEYAPNKIIYISCNPTTQARDVQLLAEKYIITKIQPVDMFPHTFHIENVVRLDLK